MEKDWEKKHKEQDKKKVERIEKLNNACTWYLLLGLVLLFLLYDSTKDVVKSAAKHSLSQGSLIAAIVVLILAFIFFFRAMIKWEEADNLTKSRQSWVPYLDEKEFIDQRFDNEFVKSILDKISAENTHFIEVEYKSLKIHSSEGKEPIYFNQYGYDHLTNYGTKQFAYYLGSHCFPEGFIIYQNKMVNANTERYNSGITDIGGEAAPKKTKLERLKRMFNWLFVQLQDILKLKTGIKLEQDDYGPAQLNDGQILVNKGYKAKSEGLKSL